MVSANVAKTLAAMAELAGRAISRDAAEVLASDLEHLPEAAVLAALSRCRKELRTFPTVAEILARIDDGRPGPEEAWAMIPKDEEGSVIWSEEMATAYGVARPLLSAGDLVAARLAFKETYVELLSRARDQRRPPKFSPSFGMDRAGQAAAVETARGKGRISEAVARALLPDRGPELERGDPEGLSRLSEVFKQLEDKRNDTSDRD